MADFSGDGGDNSIIGTDGADNFYMMIGGGADTVDARGGDEFIYFDDTCGPGDLVDGGDGDDRVILRGDYSAGVTVDFTNVERLQLESGSGGSGHGFDYRITVAADCFTVAGGFTVDGSSLETADSFSVDLRADSAGQSVTVNDFGAAFAITGGAANETFSYGWALGAPFGSFSGGAGDDTVVFQATGDIGSMKLNGGKGFDVLQLGIGANYDFTAAMLRQFEQIRLVDGGAPFLLTMADGNVARGHSLSIDASTAAILVFDGSAETNGAYSVTGTGNNDNLTGGTGGDTLTGGLGSDSFVYTDVAQSSGHHKQFDLITDLDASDHIDLSAIDANTGKAGDQAFHIVDHFTGAAGQLVLSYSAGKDLTTLAGDIDGDGKADISIHISGDHTDFTGIVL